MINTKWFVSYEMYTPILERGSIITDVTPARWLMYHTASKNEECAILYAEEISPSLAAELVHAAGIKAYYFKEVK